VIPIIDKKLKAELTTSRESPSSQLLVGHARNPMCDEAFNFTNALIRGQKTTRQDEPISTYFQRQMMSFKGQKSIESSTTTDLNRPIASSFNNQSVSFSIGDRMKPPLA
jgi:hypothetical protein